MKSSTCAHPRVLWDERWRLTCINWVGQNGVFGETAADLPVIPRVLITTAVLAAIVLPIAVAILCGVGSLLGALGDPAGSLGVSRMALACGILWVVDLICLVLMLGVNATVAVPQVGSDQEQDSPEQLPRDVH